MKESLEDRLCVAVWEHQSDDVLELLRLGANVDCFNSIGNTPLHLAIEQEDLPITQFLLGQGADPNKRTRDGYWAPLAHAVEVISVNAINLDENPDNRIVALLLTSGARVQERTADGKTALDIAAEHLNWEAEAILRAATT